MATPTLHPGQGRIFHHLRGRYLRKAGARTREALWDVIGQLLDTFSPSECRNYLTNSGYAFD
jgi:hypothetical protein